MKQPQTSLEAYEKIKPKIPTDEEVILSVLSSYNPFTYHEIAQAVRVKLQLANKGIEAMSWINPNKVSRRLKNLVLSKKIEICETRICSIAKSNCRTYRLIKE